MTNEELRAKCTTCYYFCKGEWGDNDWCNKKDEDVDTIVEYYLTPSGCNDYKKGIKK
jgi:hypothetical protein